MFFTSYCCPGCSHLTVLRKGIKGETAVEQRWADVEAGGRGRRGRPQTTWWACSKPLLLFLLLFNTALSTPERSCCYQ